LPTQPRGNSCGVHQVGVNVTLIDEFIANTTYDPETIGAMSRAYESVLKQLRDRGQPKIVREIIAKRIIELAAIGEREPNRLCETVLSEFGLVR
jgi:hypothetical protein